MLKEPLNRIIISTKLERAMKNDYSIGMLLIQSLRDQIFADKLPLQLNAITGQESEFASYSVSPFLQLAFDYRSKFEEVFYSQVVLSNEKIEFPKEKITALIRVSSLI